MPSYSLDLRENTIGAWTDKPEHFVVGVMDDDNDRDICLLRFEFAEGGTHVTCDAPDRAALIEKCSGDLHLIAVATSIIVQRFVEGDYELYPDVFYDEERGESVSLPLTF